MLLVLLTSLMPWLAAREKAATQIVLVGDSTVTDDVGWGSGFRRFVQAPAVVSNAAAGGRSSKSFIEEGRWAKALALRGDYYLIQFGHNDQPGKGPERETDPETTYAESMARYVDEARAMGAKPVLVTSLTRRQFDPAQPDKLQDTLLPYVEAVRKVAREKQVPLIDLYALSQALCEKLGPEITGGFNPKTPDGVVDRTHLDARGSITFAGLVVDELRHLVPGLAPVLREVPAKTDLRRDIEYAVEDDERLLLDVNVPEGDGPFPIAILVHGGGWSGGDKSGSDVPGNGADITPWFEPLTAAGYTWFSINYRLAPQHRWPAGFADVQTAIRWVKANAAKFKGDPRRIALFGHSAGGQLVCLAATLAKEDTRVQAVVGYAPVTDFEFELPARGGLSPSLQHLHDQPREVTPASLAILRETAPINHVKAGLPPFLLLHGDGDVTVPYQTSLNFQAKLRANGVQCDLITLPGAPHGLLTWDKFLPDYQSRVVNWLNTALGAATQPAWQSDRGDGTYQNPVLHADYSDPDAVRVGDDYWMVSSSFSQVPALPVLHSKDLVNWTLVTHALPRLVPEEAFRTPQPGKGVWAPSIRFHAGKYWIYYPDPDFGIYVITAGNPAGRWSEPALVQAGKGLIDPCPLWDDDGKIYLVHGWAQSRSGINNKLTVLELTADGRGVAGDLGFVIDADKIPGYTTLEGPKFFKRNGWYYIFAPAGGVKQGWQSVFRSRAIAGPYEDRIVLEQGKSPTNGPHQGALVDTPAGDWWFLHFQDKEAYGRIVHLQPVAWKNDWPVMGTAIVTGADKGEPVSVHAKPVLPPQPIAVPATSDEFTAPTLGLQWQWQANPDANWYSLTAKPGALRLFAQPEPKPGNLYEAPYLLMQKFPAPEFVATTKLTLASGENGTSAGLIVFGYDYAWIGLKRQAGALALVRATARESVKGEPQQQLVLLPEVTGPVWLRVTVTAGAACRFSYSRDGVAFTTIDEPPFLATVGRWVGAKVGLFSSGTAAAPADFDWFRVAPLGK